MMGSSRAICTNYPGSNLVHRYKTVKFDLMGEQPATKFYPAKSAEQTKKSKQFVLPKSHPCFLNLPIRNGGTI